MYKVLLVDDEPLILQGLKCIVKWEELNLEVAATASNGSEALSILQNQEIDILITDIRMQNVNGLELIKSIREQNKNIKCIVLSGYSEFNYVKEAAKLGIENYILKPVDKNELLSTLTTTVNKIENESTKVLVDQEGFNIIRNNILSRWISNDIEDNELYERASLLDINIRFNEYMVAIVKPLNPPALQINHQSNHQINEKNLIRSSVIDICVKQLSDHGLGIVFLNLSGNIILLFHGDHLFEIQDNITSLLSNCISDITSFLGLNAFISVGSIEKGYRNVPESYHIAKKIFDNTQTNDSYSLIKHENSEDIKVSSIIRKAIEYVNENYAKDINLSTIAYAFDINSFYLGQQFKKELGESFTNYINKIRIEKAKELLLSSTLKTVDIAKKVGYSNTNYFSTIFKKTTGFTPSEFKGE
jgi:two-component system, response regulator YesN